MWRSRGVREERTEHAQLFSRTLAGIGPTWHQKVHFSIFDGKLEPQCTRNGPQNPPYCPGSIQDTFIIYSSISHQHFSEYILQIEEISKNRKYENLKNRSWKVKVPSFVSVGTVVNLGFWIFRFSIIEILSFRKICL